MYLSEFPIDSGLKRNSQYKLVKKLISGLKKCGYDIVRFSGFDGPEFVKDGYECIDRMIEESHCLLAIVDIYWTCSTWMAHEVTHAGNHGQIPVFLYYIPDDYYCLFPREYREPKTYTLPKEISSAIRFINTVMENECCIK